MVASKIRDFLTLDNVKGLVFWGGVVGTIILWGSRIDHKIDLFGKDLQTVIEKQSQQEKDMEVMKKSINNLSLAYEKLNLELRLRRVISDTTPLPTFPPIKVESDVKVEVETKEEAEPTPQPTPSPIVPPTPALPFVPMMIPAISLLSMSIKFLIRNRG